MLYYVLICEYDGYTTASIDSFIADEKVDFRNWNQVLYVYATILNISNYRQHLVLEKMFILFIIYTLDVSAL